MDAVNTTSGRRQWLGRIIRYAPLISLILVWLLIIDKAPAMNKPAVWWLTLFTLPALGSTLYAAYRVHRGLDRRDPAVGEKKSGP